MRVALRWAGYVFGFLLLLILLAAAWVWFASSQQLNARVPASPERLSQPAPALLADAGRRARTLGCVSCHGEGLTGKPFLDDAKVARLHSPNLTLLAARSSDQQLAQAIRQGVGVDGRPLLVMPSEAYQFLGDDETAALIALIRRQPQGGEESPRRSVGPLMRLSLASGGLKTTPALASEYRGNIAADLGPAHRLGRHLALTTCSGCHSSDLRGRQVSPEMLAPDLDIAAAYDLPAFTRLLREGVAPPGRQIEEMKRVAREDSRHYTDKEIAALHAYLVARAQQQP